MTTRTDLIDRIERIAETNKRGAENVAQQQGDAGTLSGARGVARETFSQYAGCSDETWGSWVPHIPLAQSLVRYPTTIVDLVPTNSDRFIDQMGLSLEQFSTLTAEGFLKVNLTHYDSERERDFSSYLSSDGVLARLLQDEGVANAKGIYVNSAFRGPVLAHLAGMPIDLEKSRDAALARFEAPARSFAEAYQAAVPRGSVPKAWEGAIFRGQPPSPIKIAYNYSYLQCAKGLLDADADPVIQAILDDAAENRLANPVHFARFAERLEAAHKLITAPLTGAYGGTYGMNIEDSAKLSSVIEEQRAGVDVWERPDLVLESRTRKLWFAILKDIASGRLDRFGDNLGAGPGKMSRQLYVWKGEPMTDPEFERFVEFLRENREILADNARIVEEMESILDKEAGLQQTDIAYFLKAAYAVSEKQGVLLDKKFKDLAEDVLGLVETVADADPVLSVSIKVARGVRRYTEDFAVKADREALADMQIIADQFAAQSRLIVDRQKRWSL